MIFAFLAMCLGQATPAATVTLERPAVRLKDFLPELSQATGLKLAASDELQQAFVIVRMVDRPVPEALQEIATCFRAKWEDRGDTRMLVKKHDVVDPAKNDLTDEIKTYFAKARQVQAWTSSDADKYVKSNMEFAEKHVDGNITDWKEYESLNSDGLDKRLMRRIVASIGEKAFLDLKPGERVVYAAAPTQMQRPLGRTVVQSIADTVREQQYHKEALAKVGITEAGGQPNSSLYLPGLQPYYSAFDDVGNVLLVLKYETSMIRIEVDVTSKTGDTTYSTQDIINDTNGEEQKTPAQTFEIKGDFVPSSMSVSISKCLTSRMARSSTPSSAEDRELMLTYFRDLDKNELLGLSPSELMIQTSKATGKDVVVEAPDVLVVLLGFAGQLKTQKLQEFWSMFNGFHVVNLEQTDHCLYVRPSSNMILQSFKIPRTAVSKFVKSVEKSGLTIDGYADLVKELPIGELTSFVTQFALTPFPEYAGESDLSGITALQIYAQLDPASRSKAHAGGYVVNLGSAPASLQKTFKWFVYTEKGKLSVGDPNETAQQDYPSDGTVESTSVLPQGLPARGLATFKVTKSDGLVVNSVYQGGYSNMRISTPENIANQVAWSEVDPNSSQTTLSFGHASYQDLTIVLDLGDKRFVTSRFRMMGKVDSSKLTGPEGLPDDVKTLIDKRRAEYREMYKNGVPRPQQRVIKP